ncbi:hypothetical protein MRX96_014813 [Rhipicephalus microplus]
MATATVALCLVIWMLATVVYLTRQNIETSTTDTSYETDSLGDSEGQTSTKQTTITKLPQPTAINVYAKPRDRLLHLLPSHRLLRLLLPKTQRPVVEAPPRAPRVEFLARPGKYGPQPD